ncbi:Zinc finger protein ZXDC [Merluccius polli]|uniref:Zinc finger protein ZXDC n=1 Tax=Merluccius polli TaxID=89951 RepID=A0AA47NY53_MERPO|nr:Zinc finger protein ZXDC [Merluccius polli]
MEIQGLSDAQTIHSQHGAPHSTALSPFRSNTQPMFRTLSDENRDDGLLEAHQSQHDNNNNRPGTSPFRLLAENGSMARMSICKQQPKGKYHSQSDTTFANIGLCNVRENELLPQSNLRSVWKHVVDGGDAAMKMAFPFFEGEEEHLQHQLQSPGLRQQQLAGGASLQPAAPGSCNASRSHKTTEESHVVFNVVQEDGHRESAGTERQELLSTDHTMNGIPECSKITSCESTFVENINVLYVDGKACKKADCIGRVLNAQHADGEATAAKTKLPVYHTTEGTVSANRYDDTINDQLCTERIDDKLLGPLMLENTGIVNTRETMDTSDFISDPSSLQENTSADTASTSAPAHETFSGTIMINNQSIIVTIENGILTLAAPPEGYVHKDDDMVSLKEHLGMKDHEDIVLLNYDSGTKSIGKISTLAVASSSQHEPRAGLSVADAELALVDDCPLTEPSLESCPIIKQEVGTLCAITESDLVTPCSKNINTLDCDGNHDPQSVHLIRSKKETTVSFGCPQPGCASIFDTRQKLKVHFLNHAEDPRPYQCTVEDCGWAFTTSYKLKRHLQSHDKQRPHTCQFEGCGRRFTTVYNLKAHIKVHDQENAFVCEVCSERFRSATRLTNHQKVHFEPPRPHKCDFPGKIQKLFFGIGPSTHHDTEIGLFTLWCEKTFITFSALFSHNRTHFREAGHFTCSYPGCDKMYDKACRLKIHLRSHTGMI